ncbi:hypothetical protein, partial [Salmonella enterica]|uniref:hypothetical protein n=1 Tax=Salmonella enterica TaxID=28901 RepID=UPI0020C3EB59
RNRPVPLNEFRDARHSHHPISLSARTTSGAPIIVTMMMLVIPSSRISCIEPLPQPLANTSHGHTQVSGRLADDTP